MNLKIGFQIVTFLLLSLSGCTTNLDAKKINTAVPSALSGYPYQLQFTQFEITTTYELTSCEGTVEVKPSVTIRPIQKNDPTHLYVIDPAELSSWIKSTEVKIDYHDNGLLKSINGHAIDKTGEVVAGIASSVGKVLVATAGGGIAGAKSNACKDEAVTALANREKYRADMKAAIRMIDAKRAELEELTKYKVASGRYFTRQQTQGIAKAVKSVIESQKALAAANQNLTDNLKATSVTQTQIWPQDGSTYSSATEIFGLSRKESDTGYIFGNVKGSEEKKCPFDDERYCITSTLLHASFAAENSNDAALITNVDKSNKQTEVLSGFKYRFPGKGRLKIFTKACPGDSCAENVVAKYDGDITQLGYIFNVPFTSYPFTDRKFSATFNDKGAPTSLGSSNAVDIEKAVTSVGTTVDAILKVRAARDGEELADIKTEVNMLKAKKELADAQAALNPKGKTENEKAIEEFSSKTLLLNAELAYLNAEAAVKEAIEKNAEN